MSNIGLYAKAVAGALAAGGTAAITALSDGNITTVEWFTIVGATLLALGAIWAVPNTPKAVQKYGKAITGAVIAGVGAVATAYVSGGAIHPADFINIAIAVVSSLGVVFVVPNSNASDEVVPAFESPSDTMDNPETEYADESEDEVVEDPESGEGVDPLEEDYSTGDDPEATADEGPLETK